MTNSYYRNADQDYTIPRTEETDSNENFEKKCNLPTG